MKVNHALRKSALPEKAKWDLVPKPSTLPARLRRRLVIIAVLVVCICARWAKSTSFSIHYTIGRKFTAPWSIALLSAKIVKKKYKFCKYGPQVAW